MAHDTIRGIVREVTGGDTFVMEVLQVGGDNLRYNDVETIKLAGLFAPARDEPGGESALRALDHWLRDQHVLCVVKSRDGYGRVIADADLLPI